jgi:hypothetical protein
MDWKGVAEILNLEVFKIGRLSGAMSWLLNCVQK